MFSWAPKSLWMVNAAMKLKDAWSLEKSYDKPRQCIKRQRHRFTNKGPYSLSYGSSRSHVQMWELDQKKAECQRIDAFELWCWRGLLRVHWTAKRSNQSINPKGNQPWIYIGRSIAESGAPILWPPDVKSWHIGKDPEAGKDWRQKEKVVAEDEMVRSHHRLSRHEFEWTLGDSGGQMSLACCNPWDCKELDTT